MVWGAICSIGKLQLAFTSHKMDSNEYVEVLESKLQPFLNRFHRLPLRFQQDNAGIHTSRYTMDWFKAHNVILKTHPAVSPDLNIMENIWAMLVRRVYANGKQYRDKEELKKSILLEWDKLNLTEVEKLVQSMSDRVFQVVQRKGCYTDY